MSNWKTLESFEAELMEDPEFRKIHEDQSSDYAIARGILEARLAIGLSQAALAKAIGTSQGRVSKWETAEEEPRIETLRRIADATGRVLVVGLFDETPATSGRGRKKATVKRTARTSSDRRASARRSNGTKAAATKASSGKATKEKTSARKSSSQKSSSRKTVGAKTARSQAARKITGKKSTDRKVARRR